MKFKKDLILNKGIKSHIIEFAKFKKLEDIKNSIIGKGIWPKIDRLNPDCAARTESKIFDILFNIVNSDNEARIKQVALEQAVFYYDLDWYNHNLKNHMGINSAILHDMYKRSTKYLDNLVKEYTSNKFNKLLKDLESSNEGKRQDALSILIILILGTDVLIGVCHSTIIQLLSDFNHSKDTVGINQVRISITMGRRLFKLGEPTIKKTIYKIKNKARGQRYLI